MQRSRPFTRRVKCRGTSALGEGEGGVGPRHLSPVPDPRRAAPRAEALPWRSKEARADRAQPDTSSACGRPGSPPGARVPEAALWKMVTVKVSPEKTRESLKGFVMCWALSRMKYVITCANAVVRCMLLLVKNLLTPKAVVEGKDEGKLTHT